jgi:hypothetical protein
VEFSNILSNDSHCPFTGETKKRRTNGECRSIGRRAQRADSRDVRKHKYKPLTVGRAVCICAFVHRGRLPSAAQSNGTSFFVIFVILVAQENELRSSSVPSFLL